MLLPAQRRRHAPFHEALERFARDGVSDEITAAVTGEEAWEEIWTKLKAAYGVSDDELRDWDEMQMQAYLRQAPAVLRWKAGFAAEPINETLVEFMKALAASMAGPR